MSDAALVARLLSGLHTGATKAGELWQAKAVTVTGQRATLLDFEDDPDEPAEETAEAYPVVGGWKVPAGQRVAVALLDGKPVVVGPLFDEAPDPLELIGPVLLPAGSRIEGDIAPFDQQRAMQYLANAGLATITAAGAPAPSTDGTLTNDDDSGGAWIRFATGGVLGTNAGISSTFSLVWGAWEPTLIVRLRMGTDISSLRVWVALTSATVDGSSNPAGHHAGFRFDSGGDVSWQCSTKDGTTQDLESSGVVVNTSQINTLRIDLRPGHVLFSIDDAPVADMVTNLPSTTQPLGVQIRARNLAASNRFIRFGRAALLYR